MSKSNKWRAKMTSADWRLILDEQGQAVALPRTDEAMHTILREHNAHDALVEALEGVQEQIYAVGAPLGSERYFAIRQLVADVLKLAKGA